MIKTPLFKRPARPLKTGEYVLPHNDLSPGKVEYTEPENMTSADIRKKLNQIAEALPIAKQAAKYAVPRLEAYDKALRAHFPKIEKAEAEIAEAWPPVERLHREVKQRLEDIAFTGVEPLFGNQTSKVLPHSLAFRKIAEVLPEMPPQRASTFGAINRQLLGLKQIKRELEQLANQQNPLIEA